jgi:hypothetical protein
MAYEEAHATIVKALEYERDQTLENSPELGRIENLTRGECEILAHAVVNWLAAAGYDMTRRGNAHRT